MKYWADHEGFTELTEGLSDEQLLLQLRQAMGTYYDSTTGQSPTPVNNISPGMQTFARNRGDSQAEAFYIDPPSWSKYKDTIHYDDAPIVITFEDQTFYGDHAVTGIGFNDIGDRLTIFWEHSCEKSPKIPLNKKTKYTISGNYGFM